MSIPRDWGLKFYETPQDAENDITINTIDLGDIWEGETGEKTVYMRNTPLHNIKDIEYETGTPQVTVSGPPNLQPGELASLTVMWKPTLASFGLKDDLIIRGIIIYRVVNP